MILRRLPRESLMRNCDQSLTMADKGAQLLTIGANSPNLVGKKGARVVGCREP